MKFLPPFLALFILLTPVYVLGFARALDQEDANGTVFVVTRVGETTTLTAFASESNKRWLVLSPPYATVVAVPRLLFLPLETKTRPVLQSQVAPCESDEIVDQDPIQRERVNAVHVDVKVDPTHMSPDLQSYLDEGWVLREVEVGMSGQGVQFSFTSERFEIPPIPASGVAHRGELTLISIADARMEPVNFKNQLPPTNIEIKAVEETSNDSDMDRLLAAVFAEVDKNESSAFITEFALDLPSSGFDVRLDIFSSTELSNELTVTRLRRLGDLGKFSAPIQLFPTFKMAGGDNIESNGKLRSGGYSADKNDFQTRLVVQQMLAGQAPCENPVRLRASFDPTITDDVRKSLFEKWLLTDVPEIYWTVRPKAEDETKSIPKQEVLPATNEEGKAGKCSGCASAESTPILALLFALSFLRRRAR